ncbi:Cyclophilin-like peptidyl-prolyl cis-trans isomerase domain protein [Kalmanozyma brasiliensis GHG001]|uniref:Cyclophilin n=1 Tax=Kalmanozyma brasiliensis (strain GHG001) TaxID=1365824 RepID=V5F0B1_KALBG|nr:Cyclophilin-like peptidyl-prolyl cis-trans isomerase domain protein [Kalmanozyma brasiliensis GHG001]EST08629.1 Cyclophilin-like peptidyl-prolyl cis-trans isomerase domain protein [Kalmanozyma brasiliensis GHG001]
MGHGKSDRPFLSAAEHSGVYGSHGASSGKVGGLEESTFHPVSFDCCAISFQPWSIPVCSPDCGVAFELTSLIPFLRKFGVHPVTGRPFELDDVVRLHFLKNEQGRYHDPVSFKEFDQHSHLVAVRQSGNVFLWDTVQRLNVKAKYMKDLVTDEAFTKADIITIQDPNRPEERNPSSMHHVKQGLALSQADKGIDSSEQVNLGGSAQKLINQLRGSTSSDTPTSSASSSKPQHSPATKETTSAYTRNKATGASTGMTAASFTSSHLTPRTAIERITLDTEELMFQHIRGRPREKAYVRLATNAGPLNLELHCDKAPKTCYNFLQLCKQGKYDDTIFHRNIRGFMIQGGDPTGTGRGGSSIWGHEFRDEYDEPGAEKHTGRGVLSMANKGKGTNGSQFFITYRAVPHLDGKHTVFGRLVDGEKDKTLTALESIPSEEGTDRPLRKIRIQDVLVTEDPFEKYQLKQKQAAKANDPTDPDNIRRMEKRKRREADRTTWLGTELPTKAEGDGDRRSKEAGLLASSNSSIGKYLNAGAGTKAKTETSNGSNFAADSGTKKRKTAGGFGDFSGW